MIAWGLRLTGRLAAVLAAALLVSIVVFLGVHFLPGDPVRREAHQSPAQYAAALHSAGLDRPLPVQYAAVMGRIIDGDLERQLLPEAVTSAELGALAAAIGLSAGVAFGFVAATHVGTWRDRLAILGSLVGFATPVFVWGFVVFQIGTTILFNLTGGVLFYSPDRCCQGPQILMPAFVLGLPAAGYIARMTRAGMLDELGREYVLAARAKGLAEGAVHRRHVLRNAALVLITVAAPLIAAILVGSVVVEQMFNVDGLGHELTGSLLGRHYDIALGVFVYYALLVGLANLAVDQLYPVLDPRQRQRHR
jgi:peptide/nickel transport system permease protein